MPFGTIGINLGVSHGAQKCKNKGSRNAVYHTLNTRPCSGYPLRSWHPFRKVRMTSVTSGQWFRSQGLYRIRFGQCALSRSRSLGLAADTNVLLI